jgi:protein-tyrosine phosphatase
MMIDFHAHILPGLDHGCKDVATALLQLQLAKKAGIDCVVATSHFYPHIDTVDHFLYRRQKAWEKLNSALTADLPKITLGAETLICNGIENMDGLLKLAFEGTSVILIEMPSVLWGASLFDTVDKINTLCNGRAVIAHVDRYNEESIDKLFDLGVSGQINAESLCRRRRRKTYMRWIANKNIVALGSDIHGTAGGYRKFLKAKARLGYDFHNIMHLSEELLCMNQEVQPTLGQVDFA